VKNFGEIQKKLDEPLQLANLHYNFTDQSLLNDYEEPKYYYNKKKQRWESA
jgi:hypothetical protein